MRYPRLYGECDESDINIILIYVCSFSEVKKESGDEKRIPCPLDPKHSCDESRLESHLKKCPAKQQFQPSYISKQVNIPKTELDGNKLLTLSSATGIKV